MKQTFQKLGFLVAVVNLLVLGPTILAASDLTGTWRLSGQDTEYPHTTWVADLVITQAGVSDSRKPLSGYFYWHGFGGDVSGEIWGYEDFSDGVNGTSSYFDTSTMRFHVGGYQLRGVSSTRPGFPTLALAIYDADVTSDENTLMNGSWACCPVIPGVWSAERLSAPQSGTTIITHGFILGVLGGGFPDWVREMGVAILKRAGQGSLWLFDADSDTVTDITEEHRPELGSTFGHNDVGEQVLLVDWHQKSNNSTPGFAEATGHALYSVLIGGAPCPDCLGGYKGGFLGAIDAQGQPVRPLHFIGHSFGTVVNSETIQRLAVLQNPPVKVEQMTTLDPHDWDEAFVPVDGGALLPDVQIWSNINFADNYYTTEGGGASDNPHGRAILGEQTYDLTHLDGFKNGILWHPHARVHAFYLGTIDQSKLQDTDGLEITSSWYGSFPRDQVGYAHSRIGGKVNRIPTSCKVNPVSPVVPTICENPYTNNNGFADVHVNEPPTEVFDTQFSRQIGEVGSRPGFRNKPEVAEWTPGDAAAVLGLGGVPDSAFETHLTFVPSTATSLSFWAAQTRNAVFGADDSLHVIIDGEEIGQTLVSDLDSTFQIVQYAIPQKFRGQSVRILFDLRGNGILDSTLWIDNIAFVEDPPPAGSLQFSLSTYSVNEAGGSVPITVTRTGGSSGAVSVTLTTSNGTASSGSDYTVVNQTVSFANGNTVSQTVNIPILNDSLVEGNETVNLTLSNPTGGASLGIPSTAVLTIVEDDTAPAVVTITAISSPARELSLAPGTFSVARTGGDIASPLIVNFAVSGTATLGVDYTLQAVFQPSLSDSVTIPAFGGSWLIQVKPIPDAHMENDETVTITLSPDDGYAIGDPGNATVTIVSDNSAAVPTGTTPGTVGAPGPTQPSNGVMLSWNAVSGATYYSLGVRDMLTNALVVDSTTSNTNYIANLAAGGQYRWNVAACNTSGCSSFSTPLYFQTPMSGTTPIAPTPTSPSGGQVVTTLTPQFTWSGGSNFSSLQVNLSRSPFGAANIVYTSAWLAAGTTSTTPTPALVAGTNYRWDVTACSGANGAGACVTSDNAFFSTQAAQEDTIPPETNIVSGPRITANTATFTWTGRDNVTSSTNLVYAFRLQPIESNFSLFSNTTVKTYSNLTPGTYTFSVKARDGAGNEDLTPASRSFTISAADNITKLIADDDSISIGTKTPLILIHGLDGTSPAYIADPKNNSYWDNFLNYFRGSPDFHTKYKVYRFHYVSREQSVYEIARAFRNDLDYLIDSEKLADAPFVLVAHSMGGLVARSYMQEHDHDTGAYIGQRGGERILKLITLATLHHGTPAANKEPRVNALFDPLWELAIKAIDRKFWCKVEVFLCIGDGDDFVDVTEVNRSDLRWDNYNSLTGYDECPRECNAWLQDLNANNTYDSKIVAYYGFVNSSTSFQYDILDDLGATDLLDWLSEQDRTPSEQLAATAVVLKKVYSQVENDGLVPTDSARFSDHTLSKRVQCPGYDHTAMKDGNSALCSTTGVTLFDSLSSDLGVLLSSDTIPDAFSFTPQTGVALNATVTSNTITVSGINAAAPISITAGGSYSINGGAFTAVSGTVNNGNTVAVRLTSSGSFSTQTCATPNIGGVGGSFCATTVNPLSVTGLTTDKVSPQQAGTPINFTATSNNGTAPIQYKWWVFNGTAWSVARDWLASNTFNWTPTAGGIYRIGVWAKSFGNPNDTAEDFRGSIDFTITPPPLLTITSLTGDKASSQPAGTVVNFTATTTGGLAPIQFKWWLYNGAGWSVVNDWSTSNSFSWTPKAAGNYQIGVWAKSFGNTADAAEAFAGVDFSIGLRINSINASRTSPHPGGSAINFTATTSGSAAMIQYKWWLLSGGVWSIVKDWSTSDIFSWTPAIKGDYKIGVWARSSGNAVDAPENGAFDGMNFTVLGLSVNFAADKVSLQPAGASINFTATTTGGLTPIQFKWWLFNGTAWTIVKDWSTSNSFSWAPEVAGNYRIGVWARSNSNTVDAPENNLAFAGMDYHIGLSITNLTADKTSPQAAGTTINFTATTTGGVAPIQFKWWLFNGTTWTLAKNWSTGNSFSWTPTGVGNYRIGVWARSNGNIIDAPENNAFAGIDYKIGISITSLIADKSSPQLTGSTTNFTATASGSGAVIQFKWWLFTGTTWSVVKDWSTSNNFTWTPSVVGNYRIGVWARSSGNTVDAPENNAFRGMDFGIAAPAALLFVEPGGICNGNIPCFSMIQPAINLTAENAVIKVAQGTYHENLLVDSSKTFTLEGGWNNTFSSRAVNPALTVIDGDINGNGIGDSSVFRIEASAGEVISVNVNGFTIQNGKSTDGGGVFASARQTGSVNLNLVGNIIRNNESTNSGAGIGVYAEDSGSNTQATLTNNIIHNNHTAGNGAGVYGFSNLSANTTLALINNTISGNTADFAGGGLRAYASNAAITNATVKNNIIWGNSAASGDDIAVRSSLSGSATVSASYSDIGDVLPDTDAPGTYSNLGNNINADPLFVNFASGDFHLRAGSPALDAGTADGAPTVDFEGQARPQGTGFDLGADERL